MKIESFLGIILSETNYSNSSKILNVLTDQYGLVGILSKGCRNIKSKLRGVSQKLVYGTFHVYYKENGLSTLIGIDICDSFSHLMTDLEKISYASYILDLVGQVARQNEDSQIFFLLRDTLVKINEKFHPMIMTNILELKLLDYLGVRPSIDCCSICGSDKGIVTLSSDQGGFICKNCYQNETIVSEKVIQVIRMYYYVDISNISKLDVPSSIVFEINQFLENYYDRYTGLYLKSKDFIRQIRLLDQVIS